MQLGRTVCGLCVRRLTMHSRAADQLGNRTSLPCRTPMRLLQLHSSAHSSVLLPLSTIAAPKGLEGPFSLAAILAYIIFFALGAG